MGISNQETTFGREEYGCLNVYGASKIENAMCNLSGRFRGGVQGAWPPLFWVKKGNHRSKKSQQGKQNIKQALPLSSRSGSANKMFNLAMGHYLLPLLITSLLCEKKFFTQEHLLRKPHIIFIS